MYFKVRDLLDIPFHYLYESRKLITGSPKKQKKNQNYSRSMFAAIEMDTFFVLFLLLLLFQPNQRVLKTVLENIPHCHQAVFNKRKKQGERRVLIAWRESRDC